MHRSALIALPIFALLALFPNPSVGERIHVALPCPGYGYFSLRADRIAARMGAFAADNDDGFHEPLLEVTTIVKDLAFVKCSRSQGSDGSTKVTALVPFNTTQPDVGIVLMARFQVGDDGWNTTILVIMFTHTPIGTGNGTIDELYSGAMAEAGLAKLGWKSSVAGKGHSCPKITIQLNAENVLEVEKTCV